MDHYQKVKKELTKADVERLVLNSKLCAIMGWEMDMLKSSLEEGKRVDPPIEIRALDDQGDIYPFILYGRSGPYLKPGFQARGGWGDFVRKRGAQAGHTIYFWAEENLIKGTNYRIDFFPFKCHISPYPEGLSSQPLAPAEETRAII